MKKLFLLLGLSILLLSSFAYAGASDTDDATYGYTFDDADLTTGNPDDVSGNANDGTNVGSTTGVTGIIGEAFDLDGTNDEINPNGAYLNGLSAFTISGWFKADSISNSRGIYTNWAGTNNILAYFNTNTIKYYTKTSVGQSSAIVSSTISTGTWYHYVLTYDGTDMEMWLNGVSQGTTGQTGTLLSPGQNDEIGVYNSATFFDGVMDELYFYPEAKDSTFVAAMYNSGAGLQPYASVGGDAILNSFATVYNSTTPSASYQLLNYNLSYANASDGDGMTTIETTNGSVNNVNITSYGLLDINVTWGDHQETYTSFNGSSLLQINYSAIDQRAIAAHNSSAVLNFTTYNTSDSAFSQSTINGSTVIYVDKDHADLNMTNDAAGYVLQTAIIPVNAGAYVYNWSLIRANQINFSFTDSETSTLITGITVDLSLAFGNVSTNYSTTTGTILVTNMTAGNYSATYSAEGYTQGNHLFTLANRTVDEINLFLVNSSSTTAIIATVINENANVVDGVVVKVMHYDDTTGNYVLEDTETSNFQGELALDLIKFTEDYYFILEKPAGTVVLTTTAGKIVSNSITFAILIGQPVMEDFFRTQNIDTLMYFDTPNDRFIWTYNDFEGTISQACLNVYYAGSLYNYTCAGTTSGTLQMSVLNTTGRYYTATGVVTIGTTDTTIQNGEFEYFTDPSILGDLALFGLIFITLVLVLSGVRWGLQGVFLMSPVGLVLFKAAGLILIPWGVILAVVALALVLFTITRGNNY